MAAHNLVHRLAAVRETIDQSLARAGRRQSVVIVAVTKTHPADAVREALAAGLTDVGENRVQEALEKQDALPGVDVRWHLIGSMQRNKARLITGRFALIHSLDRADLAAEIGRRVPPGARQRVLLQVNCSAEPQKGGVEPGLLPGLIDDILGLPALELCGLMTMAAFDADERELRRTFGLLRRLRDEGERRGVPLPELSMGMSGDYPIAVEEGATLVRLGAILFGERT
jgi:pyridoxal phosphate enzyme (YggS family)